MPSSLFVPFETIVNSLPVMARVGGVLLFVPIPGMRALPQGSRVVLIIALGWMLAWQMPKVEISEMNPLLVAAHLVGETAIGVASGVVLGFLTETLVFAVQCVVLQAGFSYASTIDPTSEADSSVLQIFYQLFANLLFFSLGGEALILRAFLHRSQPHSLTTLTYHSVSDGVIAAGASMMELGIRLAAPLAALLLLCDLTLAILGRMHSQLQLLSMGFPIKMLSTLFLIAALGPMALTIYQRAMNAASATITHLVK